MFLVVFVHAHAQTDTSGTQGLVIPAGIADTLSPAVETLPPGGPDIQPPYVTPSPGSVDDTGIREPVITFPADMERKPSPQKRVLRIGINVVRPLFMIAEPSRFGMEAVADVNFGEKYFAVAEGGFSFRDLSRPEYRLSEEGVFFRFGADNNFYNQLDDVIALGVRIGFSVFDRSAPVISVEPDYWGEFSGSLENQLFIRQWAEAVIVLKTEVFRNVFMGWNIRGKLLLFDRGDENLNERYIPGFGSGTTKSAVGFDFYIYYRLPLRK